jgi:CDP-diacylglycerol--glycerol-3-phosphate 3-phosphatidyltransferase
MWRPAERISDGAHLLAVPVGRVVAKTGVPPNLLTIFGFLVNVGVAWIISRGPDYFLIGGGLIVVAGIFDLLDGAVARITNRVTKFGALLDSTLDRLSDAVLLFGLLWYYAWKQDASIEVILIFAAIVGSLLVSYVRARAEGLGLDADVGIMRRTVRILTLAIALMLSTFEPILLVALWGLAVLSNLTAAHRLIYVWYKSRKGLPG